MEMTNQMLSAILIFFLIGLNECRRIGGGGSIFSKPKSPSRPSFNSRPAGGPVNSRSTLGRNYGGFSGRQSTSGSGFGLGLGSGLVIGYGFGMLSRPFGYGTPGYGYDYYHRTRSPRKNQEPLECVVANYTLYTKSGSIDSEIDIEEGSKTCASNENVCFGRLTITTVNLTTFGNETTTALELQIEKGCDSIDNYSGTQKTSKGVYNRDRKCWDTNVKEVRLKVTPQASSTDYTYEYEDDDNLLSTFSVDLFADEEVRDALRLNGDVKRIHKIRQQSETCICDSVLCNTSNKLTERFIFCQMSILFMSKFLQFL